MSDDLGKLDGGRERRCRFDPAQPIDLPHLELPVEAAAWPAILLGRLPGSVRAEPGSKQGVDRQGRIWTIEREANELVGWSLEPGEGTPGLSWSREGEKLRLESSERALVVQWRERARSELRAPEPQLAAEPELADCRDLDLS